MSKELFETVVDEDYIKSMDRYREKPEGVTSIIEACSKNVVLFSEKMLGLKLYSWQVDFLSRISKSMVDEYWTKEFLALTSRQIGKSTSVAVLSLWATVFNKYPSGIHNNTTVGIFSASDVQAKKLLFEMKKLIRSGDVYMNETYKDKDGGAAFPIKDNKGFFSVLLSEFDPNNTTQISFKRHNPEVHGDILLKGSKNGSTIKSYPPTSTVLGETFSIVIEDEAGKTDRITDQFHYDYAYPTGNAADAIRVYLSTPWTPSGFFYEMADPEGVKDKHAADRLLFTTDAIMLENPKQHKTNQRIIEVMKSEGKLDEVNRAYYCRFVKGESTYFDPDKVMDVFDSEYSEYDSYKGECDLGLDFGGQVNSKTVITISTKTDEGSIIRLFHKVYPVGEDLSLIEDLEELLKRFNVQRIIPDYCPAGMFLIKQMENKGWNLTPMEFRKDKVKKYGAFRASLNRGEIRSYPDEDLKVEMLALEYGQGSRQSVIRHASGYSDDLIDSFVMSVYHYVEEESTFKYYDLDDVE